MCLGKKKELLIRDAVDMGCDSRWGGGAKPRRDITNERKGSVHDFCRV